MLAAHELPCVVDPAPAIWERAQGQARATGPSPRDSLAESLDSEVLSPYFDLVKIRGMSRECSSETLGRESIWAPLALSAATGPHSSSDADGWGYALGLASTSATTATAQSSADAAAAACRGLPVETSASSRGQSGRLTPLSMVHPSAAATTVTGAAGTAHRPSQQPPSASVCLRDQYLQQLSPSPWQTAGMPPAAAQPGSAAGPSAPEESLCHLPMPPLPAGPQHELPVAPMAPSLALIQAAQLSTLPPAALVALSASGRLSSSVASDYGLGNPMWGSDSSGCMSGSSAVAAAQAQVAAAAAVVAAQAATVNPPALWQAQAAALLQHQHVAMLQQYIVTGQLAPMSLATQQALSMGGVGSSSSSMGASSSGMGASSSGMASTSSGYGSCGGLMAPVPAGQGAGSSPAQARRPPQAPSPAECLVGVHGAYQSYCTQIITPELNEVALHVLRSVRALHLAESPLLAAVGAAGGPARGKRYFCSIKEVLKVAHRAAAIVVAPDVRYSPTATIEPVRLLQAILRAAQGAGVPVAFALSRRGIGQVFGPDKNISVVAIMHASQCEPAFDLMLTLASAGRDMWASTRGAAQAAAAAATLAR